MLDTWFSCDSSLVPWILCPEEDQNITFKVSAGFSSTFKLVLQRTVYPTELTVHLQTCDSSPMCGSHDQSILGSMCLLTQTVLQPRKCHNAWHLGNPNTPKITHTMPACSAARCIHIHPRWDCLWVDAYSKTMQEGHLRASLER